MNSRQTQRTLPGRGSVLLVSFPTLLDRSSSPPLITNPKTAPHVTSQFVRLGESPLSRLTSPLHGRSSSKVLRENNSLQNSDPQWRSFPLSGNKKSFSALDLRSAQKISHDQSKNLWPKRSNAYSKLANSGGIENLTNGSQYRSVSTSTNFAGNKNTYAHGSILKKSENHPDDYEASYDEFISSMKSKRKVLFKNKVSVFRFDSDGESGQSHSECAKNQTLQYRRQRSMTSKGAFIPPLKSLPPPPPLHSSLVVPFQRQKVFPTKLKPKSSIRNESVYLILGDEMNEKERVHSSSNGGSSTSSILSNYSASPQPSRQHEYESILYKTPSGAFIINNSSKEQDDDSLSNSVGSSKSSKETSGLANSKPSKNSDNSSSNTSSTFSNSNNDLLRHPKKETTFGYHVTSDSNKLVITVKLGLTLHPNDVLVKANKNGTKLRIVTNPDSSTSIKLDEQIMLPIQLNPYKLSAKIDQTGNLMIEAPISK